MRRSVSNKVVQANEGVAKFQVQLHGIENLQILLMEIFNSVQTPHFIIRAYLKIPDRTLGWPKALSEKHP